MIAAGIFLALGALAGQRGDARVSPADSANGREVAGPVALGVSLEGGPGLGSIDAFSRLVGRRPALVMWFQNWSEPLFWPGQPQAVFRRGATPVITWEPTRGVEELRLADIARGDFDPYIRTQARAAARLRHLVLIRFAHEMNLTSSAWGPQSSATAPADFRQAWRHVVTIFRAERATNVRWVWSPNVDYGGAPFTQFYPGDRWVDWVALGGYNWGAHKASGWRSLGAIFGSSYDTMRRLTRKPLMIAETAAPEAGGDKAAWIRSGLLRDVPRRLPGVRALVWFDRVKETDWRVNSSPATLSAFRLVAHSTRYRGGLSTRIGGTAGRRPVS